jgi:hypothetical protein
MSNDSEPEIDSEAILALIEDGESGDDTQQPSEEFVDAVTTNAGDLHDILASDEESGRAAVTVQRALTGRESEYLTEQEHDDRYHRHAPSIDDYATWLRLDFADGDEDTCWPFALDEDKESESDE